jgi:hypothetical protein
VEAWSYEEQYKTLVINLIHIVAMLLVYAWDNTKLLPVAWFGFP